MRNLTPSSNLAAYQPPNPFQRALRLPSKDLQVWLLEAVRLGRPEIMRPEVSRCAAQLQRSFLGPKRPHKHKDRVCNIQYGVYSIVVKYLYNICTYIVYGIWYVGYATLVWEDDIWFFQQSWTFLRIPKSGAVLQGHPQKKDPQFVETDI